MAGPPSGAYRLRKFVRRHRVGVLAAAVAGVAVVLGALLATIGLARALEAERAAREAQGAAMRQAAVSERVSSFLVDLFRLSDPWTSHSRVLTAREILDQGAKRISSGSVESPEVLSRIAEAIALSYMNLELAEEAVEVLDASVDELRRDGNADDLVRNLTALAKANFLAYRSKDDVHMLERCEELAMESLDLQSGAEYGNPALRADTLNYLANCRLYRTRLVAPVLPLYEEALRLRIEALGPEHLLVGDSTWNLGLTHIDDGRPEDGERYLERALSIYAASGGAQHMRTVRAGALLSYFRIRWGHTREVGPLVRAALENLDAALPPSHPVYDEILVCASEVLWVLGQRAEARDLLRGRLTLLESTPLMNPAEVKTVGLQLALLLAREGRREEAAALYDRVSRLAAFSKFPPKTEFANHESAVLSLLGRTGEAVAMLERHAGGGLLLDEVWIFQSPDLEPLSGLPRFEKLRAEFRSDVDYPHMW
jgi:tetratricopeptide (TPR) repeat protein